MNRTLKLLKEVDRLLKDPERNHEKLIHAFTWITTYLDCKQLEGYFSQLEYGEAIKSLVNDPYFKVN